MKKVTVLLPTYSVNVDCVLLFYKCT